MNQQSESGSSPGRPYLVFIFVFSVFRDKKMSSAGRPGGKARTSQADKNFEAQKLRMLERAEKNLAKA
jgi:hypothetical protein